MESSRPEVHKNRNEEWDLAKGDNKDWSACESACPQEEQDSSTNGKTSRSTSRGSQRLSPVSSGRLMVSCSQRFVWKSFHTRLKWLFHSYDQDLYHVAEKRNSEVVHDPQTRSTSLLQVFGVGSLKQHYGTLSKLLEHRALLLLLHESTRRTRHAAAFISRLQHLLQEQLMTSQPEQILLSWSSLRTDLLLHSQELGLHLNHWQWLLASHMSDPYLRCSIVQITTMLLGIKQVLDSLGLQSLVLMQQVQYILMSAVARTEMYSVPREVLEDIVGCTHSYSQVVEEQRTQHSSTLRMVALHPTQFYTSIVGQRLPATFMVEELAEILAEHYALQAIKQLQCCESPPTCQNCPHFHRQDTQPSSSGPDQQNDHQSSPQCLLHQCSCHNVAVLNQQNQFNCPQSGPSWGDSVAPQWPSQVHALATGQQLLFHFLGFSTDMGATATHALQEKTNYDQAELNQPGTELNKDMKGPGSSENAKPEAMGSFVFHKTGMEVKEPDGLGPTQSVRWLDLIGGYRSLLGFYFKEMLPQVCFPPPEASTRITNLQHGDRCPLGLQDVSGTTPTSEKDKLENVIGNLLVTTACAQWDHVLCMALGSALTDKCLTDAPQSGRAHEEVLSVTMKNFLLLFHRLLKLQCPPTRITTVSCPSLLPLHSSSVDLALASVQLATVWVMSKSQQFLSSWSLKKFLLITEGDLAVLRVRSETLLCQMKSVLMMSGHCQNHSHLLLRGQTQRLHQAVTRLQTFSSTVLSMFSNHCKRKSSQIFEQTMPPPSHWRPSCRTGFSSSSSEYASLAASAVIGQVLECVTVLSEDAAVQALSITTTAFLEAWMEHILKEKIKFSVQGALQLKQDFDSIREIIQSHDYGLPAELHQKLLNLRVFRQVDSAVTCLLQQPQSRHNLRSRTWLPFTRCCQLHSSTDSINAVVGSSITNLKFVEAEESDTGTTDLQPSTGTSTPGESYLAPSASLDDAQQQWLNLRMSSDHRWRMPRLRRLFNLHLNTNPSGM